jgi:hypothetical protein
VVRLAGLLLERSPKGIDGLLELIGVALALAEP